MIKKKRYIIANITYCLCKKLLIASLHYLIWASLVTQTVKNLPAVQETWDQSLGREISWRREWLPTIVFLPGNHLVRGAWWATVHGVGKSWT